MSVIVQERVVLPAHTRGLHDITDPVRAVVAGSGVLTGLCHVFLQHTSASLVVQENADPDVLRDIEDWMGRLVQDGDPRFRHTAEGPDDMSAHIRALLTCTDLNLPVVEGDLGLGTWQGIYLYEHRQRPHTRRLVITVLGR